MPLYWHPTASEGYPTARSPMGIGSLIAFPIYLLAPHLNYCQPPLSLIPGTAYKAVYFFTTNKAIKVLN